MDQNKIAKAIYQTAHLTGTFTLRSGQISNDYFDKYLFEADPALLSAIATVMKEKIPIRAEILAGLEMGGIPIATALSLQTGIPTAFVRKKAKEYGTCKQSEGANVSGKRVCIVEDVVTTGGAIIDAARELRRLGAIVDSVICVVQRGNNAIDILAKNDLKLIPAFTMEEIVRLGAEI